MGTRWITISEAFRFFCVQNTFDIFGLCSNWLAASSPRCSAPPSVSPSSEFIRHTPTDKRSCSFTTLRGKGPGKKLLQNENSLKMPAKKKVLYTKYIHLKILISTSPWAKQNLHSIAYQLFSGVAVLWNSFHSLSMTIKFTFFLQVIMPDLQQILTWHRFTYFAYWLLCN